MHTLKNRNYIDESHYNLIDGVSGINLAEHYMTKERVDAIKQHGGTIGVWFGKKVCPENEELYSRIFNAGVDYFYSDCPLEAMQARDKMQPI